MSDFDATQALEALSEIHGPGNRATLKGENYCGVCNEKEPCSIRLLLAELERLKAENHAEVDNLLADAIYQRERAEKLEEALQFYADDDNWSGPSGDEMVETGCCFSIPTHEDRGERAREALRPTAPTIIGVDWASGPDMTVRMENGRVTVTAAHRAKEKP